MDKVAVTRSKLTGIADALRVMMGTERGYTLDEIKEALLNSGENIYITMLFSTKGTTSRCPTYEGSYYFCYANGNQTMSPTVLTVVPPMGKCTMKLYRKVMTDAELGAYGGNVQTLYAEAKAGGFSGWTVVITREYPAGDPLQQNSTYEYTANTNVAYTSANAHKNVVLAAVLTDADGREIAHDIVNYGKALQDSQTDNQYAYTGPTRVTPSESEQTLAVTGKVIRSNITMEAIPARYKDVSGVTAGAGDVLAGAKIVTAAGEVEGNIPTYSGNVFEIGADGLDIPRGYHDGTTRAEGGAARKTWLFESGYGNHEENGTVLANTVFSNGSNYTRRAYSYVNNNEYIRLYANRQNSNSMAFCPIGWDFVRGEFKNVFVEASMHQITDNSENLSTYVAVQEFTNLSATSGYYGKNVYASPTIRGNEYRLYQIPIPDTTNAIIRFAMMAVNGREVRVKNVWLE